MQALPLKPAFGWNWIKAGWRLFRNQPLGFVALLFFSTVLLTMASSVVGMLGRLVALALPFVPESFASFAGVLAFVLSPALTVGYMQACRAADQGAGQTTNPLLLFAPFRAGRKVLGGLLLLGAIQTVAFVFVVSITRGLVPPAPVAAPTAAPAAATATSGAGDATPASPGTTSPPRDANDMEIDEETVRRVLVARSVQAGIYLPVAIVMCFAAMLVAWHGLPAGKALFFATVGVWRNLGAFAVCGLGWVAIWTGVSFVFGVIAGLIGSTNFAALLAVPLVMVLMTWMYCSMYPMFASIFVDDRVAPMPPASEATA